MGRGIPEMLLSADAMKGVMEALRQVLAGTGG